MRMSVMGMIDDLLLLITVGPSWGQLVLVLHFSMYVSEGEQVKVSHNHT